MFQQRDRVLIQQFCGGCHWHNLCLIGPESRAYYWEPIAKNTLSSRHPIRTAFNNAAPDGWQLECIALQAQADGHSCGDWAHYFRTRMLRYAADDSLIGTGTFADFLAQGLINLMTLRGSARQTAERSQRRIARQRESCNLPSYLHIGSSEMLCAPCFAAQRRRAHCHGVSHGER